MKRFLKREVYGIWRSFKEQEKSFFKFWFFSREMRFEGLEDNGDGEIWSNPKIRKF